MKPLQKRYQYLEHFRNAIQSQTHYPFGTIAYYGPTDQEVTKIVAAVLPDAETNPILKSWTGTGVGEKPEVAAEIGEFFRNQEVQNVVMTEDIIGC